MKKTDITFEEKVTELKMDIKNPKSQTKVFLLLEGDTDVRLFRKLCNAAHCKIEAIPGGKIKLERALVDLLQLHKAIIAIKDADFEHLKTTPALQHAHLFLTDVHDCEMLIASPDKKFSDAISILCDEDKTQHNNLKIRLLSTIIFISYFKWYNEQNNLEFNFAAVRFGDITDFNTFEINSIEYIKKAIAQSPNAKIKDVNTILADVEALFSPNIDILQLCNGHDFMQVILHYINLKNPKGLKENHVSDCFRSGYNINDFKKTQLYQDTAAWARKSGYNIYED